MSLSIVAISALSLSVKASLYVWYKVLERRQRRAIESGEVDPNKGLESNVRTVHTHANTHYSSIQTKTHIWCVCTCIYMYYVQAGITVYTLLVQYMHTCYFQLVTCCFTPFVFSCRYARIEMPYLSLVSI